MRRRHFTNAHNAVTDSRFVVRVISFPIYWLPLLIFSRALSGLYFGVRIRLHFSSIYVDHRISFGTVILTNVIVMSLTAGRVWWIRRDAALVLGAACFQYSHRDNLKIRRALLLQRRSLSPFPARIRYASVLPCNSCGLGPSSQCANIGNLTQRSTLTHKQKFRSRLPRQPSYSDFGAAVPLTFHQVPVSFRCYLGVKFSTNLQPDSPVGAVRLIHLNERPNALFDRS
ncbi:hypothetical protein B0H16DRAFT_1518090 [Mycena metata]|uniref:Uncharacterized protein n=1 Tax=Mycena metata TaxID=1033252 RepID=A0AAD7JQ40_9AGAR|nr:hypothetical protein B0H16DRAFT_1518090 [Mycena metata]